MKQGIFYLVVLLICLTACKKEDVQLEDHSYKGYGSTGDLLVVVVSDSVEYAVEYENYGSSVWDSLPITPVLWYSNGSCQGQLFVSGMEPICTFEGQLSQSYGGVVEFPQFYADWMYYANYVAPWELVHLSNGVPLDSGHLKVLTTMPYLEEEDTGWEEAWLEINDLRVVKEYRNGYPNSKVGYMRLALMDGTNNRKHYFFCAKTSQ